MVGRYVTYMHYCLLNRSTDYVLIQRVTHWPICGPLNYEYVYYGLWCGFVYNIWLYNVSVDIILLYTHLV